MLLLRYFVTHETRGAPGRSIHRQTAACNQSVCHNRPRSRLNVRATRQFSESRNLSRKTSSLSIRFAHRGSRFAIPVSAQQATRQFSLLLNSRHSSNSLPPRRFRRRLGLRAENHPSGQSHRRHRAMIWLPPSVGSRAAGGRQLFWLQNTESGNPGCTRCASASRNDVFRTRSSR
jgi:hypothetical protein